MGRPRTIAVWSGGAAASAAGTATMRHRGADIAHMVAGGTLIGDAAADDALSLRVIGSLHEPIAADVAAVARERARVPAPGDGPRP